MATGALEMAAELGTGFFAFLLHGEKKQRSVLKAGRSENKKCLWKHRREEQKIIIKEEKSSIKCMFYYLC